MSGVRVPLRPPHTLGFRVMLTARNRRGVLWGFSFGGREPRLAGRPPECGPEERGSRRRLRFRIRVGGNSRARCADGSAASTHRGVRWPAPSAGRPAAARAGRPRLARGAVQPPARRSCSALLCVAARAFERALTVIPPRTPKSSAWWASACHRGMRWSSTAARGRASRRRSVAGVEVGRRGGAGDTKTGESGGARVTASVLRECWTVGPVPHVPSFSGCVHAGEVTAGPHRAEGRARP